MMDETLQGGTRLSGQSPLKQAGLPVVSVITVVYNSRSLVEKTIRSIAAQTYPNIEFLVIDGGSSDGTLEVIRRNEQHISYWVSEPDHGIYDAMNKGLTAASGNFVWFINAGDLVYTHDTLSKVFERDDQAATDGQIPGQWADVYYGDTMIVDADYREVGLRRLRPPEVLTWKSFKKGMLVCHQAILVSREIAEPFDPQYKHSADFDWVVRVLKKAEGRRQEAVGSRQWAVGSRQWAVGSRQKAVGSRQEAINTHLILCAFLDGGHSKKNIGISLRERFHSMTRHYGFIPTLFRHVPIVFRFGWYWLRNKRF
jgi:glycosyltransferase involved in cell wall biosynthesis